MSFSKVSAEPSLLQRALFRYILLLQNRPILVKSCSSAITSGLGNSIAQLLKPPEKRNWKSVLPFVILGFCYVGPMSHYLYLLLERMVPQDAKFAMIKRLLIDRLLFTPPVLMAYLYALFLMEGKGHQSAVTKLKQTYAILLVMNWRVWTIFQFINVNFVPPIFRVLFANVVGLGWTVLLASKRK